jgi:hypothetical protein
LGSIWIAIAKRIAVFSAHLLLDVQTLHARVTIPECIA